MPTLTHDEARGIYNRVGQRQDGQGWYEDAAIARLEQHSRLASAGTVLELGCGTGRLARRLLATMLPPEARYLGLDVSPVMVAIAQDQLAPFGARAEVRLTDGSVSLLVPDASIERVLATYVLDLLSIADIGHFLSEARRVLVPGGLLCVAGLTRGGWGPAGVVSALWSAAHAVAPARLGGCRPLELTPLLAAGQWRLLHRSVVRPWGIASEAIVAERIDRGPANPQ